MNDLISIVSGILVLILILMMAYFASRFLGKNYMRNIGNSHMRIIDQFAIGQDRSLLIIKIKEKYYLIGSAPGGIQMLTELEGEFEEQDRVGTSGSESFAQYISRYRDQLTKGKDHSK
ncbi:flagellar biosynthetic protein FliO [[Clostridium] aminophilum]|uniref:Flagellar protein n=1 Tax=[Clostridium] aminophilum TaxID=1526 RepID=A0A1I6IUL9_9FIRM|nr:flagellar biosynthetic protein FliO [[Clostridium] aminophilum]MCR4629023.1 flagellar biosynthetic protein FliO [Clostridium sp.]SFR70397.1 flagellar protein FliO/FliZ [[Clostridium] aminophilum]